VRDGHPETPSEKGSDSRRAGSNAADGSERASGVGPYLAAQRRLRGISLDALADRTKIPRRNIERLESGAFDAAPDGFARGFVRTVAEALGLDPDEAVMRLMREPADDDAELASARRMRAILVGAGLCTLGVVALILLIRLASSLLAPAEPGAGTLPENVYRRDAVRALAEIARERGEVPAESPANASQVPTEGAEPAPSEPLTQPDARSVPGE
jgi:transcriptional regulator with XRE-family HTH domain